jgi:hypothetical protein
MIDNLRKLHVPVQGETRHQGASIAISFVYCDSHVHRTEEDIAASFLSQLILSHSELISQETQQKLNQFKRLGRKPSFSELIRLLKVESRRLTCHYLFLDAFDEIPDDRSVVSFARGSSSWRKRAQSEFSSLLDRSLLYCKRFKT